MVEEKIIITGSGGGGKGGGGGHTPIEAPDSLHSYSVARVIDLISEGEIEGLVNGLQSIYLDDTQAVSSTGTPNFPGLKVQWRNGSQHQTYIPGFPSVENGTPVEVELRQGTPFVRDFTNTQMTRLRVDLAVPSLMQTDTSTGDTNGYTVEMAIDLAVDDGPYQQQMVVVFSGKTTSKYTRSYSINLPPANSRWSLRVRRITGNADSGMIADQTFVDAITEIIDGKFTYPNSAIIGIEVNSEQFQSIPRRAYHVRGIKVLVPSNYDPITRVYTGVWNGSFKRAWTNNPAWIFFDLITNTRYGLGDRIPAGSMDKWALYDIGRYCDQMVPDGFGGTEPRFTVNVQITERENAYDLIQKLASVFQGMAYYATGFVTAVADQPKDTIATYTNSDVLNSEFTYGGSPKSTRYSVALVGWQDMTNFGKQEVEYVSDADALRRYGYNEVQMTAFGCTSRGQAHRAGKWALLTSNIETQTCTFTVGLKGLKSRPGDIIEIADQDLIGEPMGGLIAAATSNSITTDCDVNAKAGDTLKVMLPTGVAQARTIQSIVGRKITVTSAFSQVPQPEATWVVDGDVRLQTYRVLTIREQEDGTQYELECLEYRPDKFDAIAFDTRLEPRPVTKIPPSVQPPPENVRLSQEVKVNQGIASTTGVITWDQTPNAIAYEGAWRRNEGEWIPFTRTGSLRVEIPNIFSGRYVAQVRAINALDVRSIPAFSIQTELRGKDTPPPVVTHLTTTPVLWGVNLSWGFAAQGAEDVQRSEVWASPTPVFEDATKITDLAYPQSNYAHMLWVAAKDMYYWVRLVDRSGNFGDFYPEGEGVHGESSSDTNSYLDAIRDDIVTTELAKSFIEGAVGTQIDEALEISRLMDEAERHIREDEDAIVNRRVESLAAEVDENVTAKIEELEEVVVTETGALATKVTTLETRVDENQSTVESALTSISTETEAIAQSVTDLQTQVGEDISSAVSTVMTALSDSEAATAMLVSNLATRVGDNESAITTTASTVADTEGKLNAMYTMKTTVTSDGKRYVAGIGLGVENDPGGSGFISQILLQADRVALVNTATNGVTVPFVIQGGQTFIANAMIATAAITTAKIADAQITTAKIANAQITNAKIADATITNAKIANATITTAKIGTAQIDRLRIGDQAVTAASAFDFGVVYPYIQYTWLDVHSVNFTLPEASHILLFFEVTAFDGVAPGVRVLLNGGIAMHPLTLRPTFDDFGTPVWEAPIGMYVGMHAGVAGVNNIRIQMNTLRNNGEGVKTLGCRMFVLSRYR